MDGGENNAEPIYKDLSYKIVGILFDVHNEVGFGYQEKYYQRAIAQAFVQRGIPFREQLPFNLTYREQIIGRYYLDFLIDDKIILEIKRGNHFSRRNVYQVTGYLKRTGLLLAILANFTSSGVKFMRLLNLPDRQV